MLEGMILVYRMAGLTSLQQLLLLVQANVAWGRPTLQENRGHRPALQLVSNFPRPLSCPTATSPSFFWIRGAIARVGFDTLAAFLIFRPITCDILCYLNAAVIDSDAGFERAGVRKGLGAIESAGR